MSKSTYSTEIEHDIAAAVQNFESMLREQVARNERMRSESCGADEHGILR